MNIGLILKVIRLKLFLDMELGSSADVTRVLRRCFREGFVYASLKHKRLKAKKISNAV